MLYIISPKGLPFRNLKSRQICAVKVQLACLSFIYSLSSLLFLPKYGGREKIFPLKALRSMYFSCFFGEYYFFYCIFPDPYYIESRPASQWGRDNPFPEIAGNKSTFSRLLVLPSHNGPFPERAVVKGDGGVMGIPLAVTELLPPALCGTSLIEGGSCYIIYYTSGLSFLARNSSINCEVSSS